MKSGIGLVLLVLGFTCVAEESSPSIYDRIWGFLEFVDNDEAKVMQGLALKGRLQADAAYFDSNQGDYCDAVWRRFRIGGKGTFFHDFVLHAEADIDLNKWGSNASYKGITDAYAGWYPGTVFSTKVGKQSAGFTLDGATSSTKLLTLERSIVAENLWFSTEYFTGASGFGSTNGWSYKLAGFSASGDPEFGGFDSGWFALASLGREVAQGVNLRLDYVYNDPDYSGDVGTADLRNVLSFVSRFEKGKSGLWADLSTGEGISGQSDLVGFQLMPFYSFTDVWQLVLRYAIVHGLDGAGVRKARYPTGIDSAPAETVADYYLGLNCFVYGHKLKWQSGVEYTSATGVPAPDQDYEGWGVSTGFRISW